MRIELPGAEAPESSKVFAEAPVEDDRSEAVFATSDSPSAEV
tara:strand:- start:347 stop:472 length:126 start_codon:yes stop_codon:yes gene_type:complete